MMELLTLVLAPIPNERQLYIQPPSLRGSSRLFCCISEPISLSLSVSSGTGPCHSGTDWLHNIMIIWTHLHIVPPRRFRLPATHEWQAAGHFLYRYICTPISNANCWWQVQKFFTLLLRLYCAIEDHHPLCHLRRSGSSRPLDFTCDNQSRSLYVRRLSLHAKLSVLQTIEFHRHNARLGGRFRSGATTRQAAIHWQNVCGVPTLSIHINPATWLSTG